MATNIDLYRILEVHPDASDEVIKKAYKTLAAKYHPDVSSQSIEQMQDLNLAYEVLSDPGKRHEYDSQLKLQESGPSRDLVDTVSVIFSILFIVGLAKLLFKAFPPIAILIVPVGLLILFTRYPKTVAKLYMSILRPIKK